MHWTKNRKAVGNVSWSAFVKPWYENCKWQSTALVVTHLPLYPLRWFAIINEIWSDRLIRLRCINILNFLFLGAQNIAEHLNNQNYSTKRHRKGHMIRSVGHRLLPLPQWNAFWVHANLANTPVISSNERRSVEKLKAECPIYLFLDAFYAYYRLLVRSIFVDR